MIKLRNELLSKKILKGLESRNITGYFTENKEEALDKALEIIKEGSSISWGGSASVEAIGLKDALKLRDHRFYDRNLATNPAEKLQIERESFFADYFLTSTNAITEDGILVNIDGNANRVACIAYGPSHVIMIVGMNKVAKNLEDAMSRARNIAAPINAQRFDLKTPCNSTGSCANCLSINNICCQFLTTRFSKHPDRIHVILVNEDLGF